MNESKEGRDGYIVARGRRIYHVYKQSFPMEFIYGLTPDANRETSPGLIDVRTLPEKYRTAPVEIDCRNVTMRGMPKLMRNQIVAHILAFANAIHDGYDLEAHAAREEAAAEEEWKKYREEQAAKQEQAARDREALIAAETPEAAMLRHIDTLRADEGDSVTILCANPDPDTVEMQQAIVCNGEWTQHEDRRFYAATLSQCLADAALERELYDEIPF